MGRFEKLGIGLGLALGLIAAVSCEEAGSGSGSAATLCEGLEGYVSSCGSLSPCENALARDCGGLEGALNANYAAAFTDCLNGLGTPMGCAQDAVAQTPSSSKMQAFAQTLCLCSDGASDACESDVLTGENSDLGRAGRLARILSDDALAEVESECTGGENCTADFEDCALDVLSRSVPGETAGCLADAVLGRFSDDCSGADTDGGTDSGSDTDPTDPSAGSDPTSDTDTSDTSDSSGDTDGLCTEEGCGCMFNEDCDDGLVCMDVCSAPAECGDDPNEPNNGEIQATFLPPIGDSDDPISTIVGELEAPTDVDWFRYEGADNAGSVVNPYAQLNVMALELCVYIECQEGLEATSVTCPEGTTQQPSGGGRPGCCASNTMGFEVDMDCGDFNPFGDDSAIVYMSVNGSEPGVCQEYTLTYHF